LGRSEGSARSLPLLRLFEERREPGGVGFSPCIELLRPVGVGGPGDLLKSLEALWETDLGARKVLDGAGEDRTGSRDAEDTDATDAVDVLRLRGVATESPAAALLDDTRGATTEGIREGGRVDAGRLPSFRDALEHWLLTLPLRLRG